MVSDPRWRELALCAQTDPEAFFPEDGNLVQVAKRICAMCDVKGDCLEDALTEEEQWGVRAGMPERLRRAMRTKPPDLSTTVVSGNGDGCLRWTPSRPFEVATKGLRDADFDDGGHPRPRS
jgi:WhiB family redox-sensing transcriptional regulator